MCGGGEVDVWYGRRSADVGTDDVLWMWVRTHSEVNIMYGQQYKEQNV